MKHTLQIHFQFLCVFLFLLSSPTFGQTVPPAPYVDLSQTSDYGYVYCANKSYTLTAAGCQNGTIRWYNKTTNTFIGNNPATVVFGTRNSYYATCLLNGLESSPSPTLNYSANAIAPPAISSTNYNLSAGQTTTLTASDCDLRNSVYWSDGQIGHQITVSPNQTTRYTAICHFTGGRIYISPCDSPNSNEITITVNASSAPTLSATNNTVCSGESVILSASNCAGTINWSTGVSGSSSISVSPTQTTDYSASCVINSVESPKANTTITVNQATAITTQPNQTVACEGNQTSLSVSAAGSGNITYLWSKNGQALTDAPTTTPQLILQNITTANDGNYQVKVTGACGVVQSNTVSLQVSPKMNASITAQPTNCPGDASGSLTVSVSGGLDGKQYRLSTQSDYQSPSAFTSLRAGTYTVQTRDQAGCTTEVQGEIKQPDPITFTVKAPTNAKCAGGSDGAIDVQAAGGNGNFNYAINGGADQSSGQFQNLKANTTYTLKATDAKGCSETTNAYVGAPNQIIVSPSPTSVLCADGNTGKITVSASGGTGAYRYQLGQNPQQISSTFGDLKAGTYTITVKDDNGCLGSADVTVNQPTPVNIKATATLISCLNDSSASVTVSASGGTGAYLYQIGARPFQGNATFNNVREGTFPVNGKDANGCQASTSIAVKKADPLLLQATSQAASCCTCRDGSVILTSSGGIGQKQYSLGQIGFQSGSKFTSLMAGQYPVTVRDEAGCPTSQTVTIANATALTLTLTNIKQVNCTGGHDGSATVQVTGSNGKFTYAWQAKNPSDSLGSGSTVTHLPEGEFTVTVTDTNQCSSVTSGTLTAQNPIPPKPTITQSGGDLVSSASSGVQWYSGTDPKTGTPVANATQATFTPYQSSSYFIITTVNNCVSPPSDIFTFVLTALEPVVPLTMCVVPNPISERLRVEIEQPDRAAVHIQLIDLSGKTILDVQTPAFSGRKQFEWSVQQARSGTYLLQAEAGIRRSAKRVVIY